MKGKFLSLVLVIVFIFTVTLTGCQKTETNVEKN